MRSFSGKPPSGGFAKLGAFAARRPWWLLGAWLLLLLLAAPLSQRAPARLFGGSGDIAGSASLRADSLLNADFANPYSQLLVVTLRDTAAADSLSDLVRRLDKALSGLTWTGAVMTTETMLDKRLLPAPGTGEVILIGIKAASVRETELAIPAVRAAVDSVLLPVRQGRPGLDWAVTGRAALTYDLNLFSTKDTAAAEGKVLPLTLIILLLAFGSVAASGIPVSLGIVATTVAMAAVGWCAGHWVVSNIVQSTVSMIGLSVGIDYSLLIVHRYREALAARAGDARGAKPDRRLQGEAMAECLATAGQAVFLSGLTVMIGLGGTFFTPIMETRSIGWGGCIVVCVSVAAALTLLPPLLVVLGGALEWPRVFSRRFAGAGSGARWRAWSEWVMRRAPLCACIGLACIAVLAWPARYSRFGFPERAFIPQELGFTRGYAMLEKMGLESVVRPINVILTAPQGGILDSSRIPALYGFSAAIRKDPAVARILGPVDLSDKWPVAKYLSLYADTAAAWETVPFVRDAYLSRDGRSLLMEVLCKPEVLLEEQKTLARKLPSLAPSGVSVEVGGQAVYYNDFDRSMRKAYAPSIGFVLAVTFAALLAFFRSPLVACKALAMNALSVLAGYGMVVFVFQLGYGASLFGAPGPTDVVPLTIPLMIFCILFGLSMDYEVFLLSRIREGWLSTGNNTRAVAEGVAATGRMITNAAMIMVAVFGAFAFARVVLVQMLGLGLAVAVLVDATIIRVLLVPSLMRMAGKWNWWPASDPERGS